MADAMQNRRGFLQSAAMAAAMPLFAMGPGKAQAAAKLALQPLADRLWRVTGLAGNVVLAGSDDGLLLVDGGAAAQSQALAKLLAKQFPGKSLRAVFNTHWHHAQSGFNATARKMGAEVLAHENTKLWLSTVVNSTWEGKVYAPQAAAALPTRTFFYGAQSFEFGGRKIEYGHLGQAHTDGDIYVRFPEENVLAVGDTLTPGRYPIVDAASNGWLGGLFTATKTLVSKCDASTRVIAALGEVAGIEALKAQEEMSHAVLSRIGESYYKGQTYQEFLASNPTQEFNEKFGDPSLFLKLAYDTAWYHVTEIRRVAR